MPKKNCDTFFKLNMKRDDWYTFQNSHTLLIWRNLSLILLFHNKNEGSSIDVHLVVMSRFYVFKHCSKLATCHLLLISHFFSILSTMFSLGDRLHPWVSATSSFAQLAPLQNTLLSPWAPIHVLPHQGTECCHSIQYHHNPLHTNLLLEDAYKCLQMQCHL